MMAAGAALKLLGLIVLLLVMLPLSAIASIAGVLARLMAPGFADGYAFTHFMLNKLGRSDASDD